jgi:hypothetical protein
MTTNIIINWKEEEEEIYNIKNNIIINENKIFNNQILNFIQNNTENNQKCFLTLNFKNNIELNEIKIISNSKLIELYYNDEIYLETLKFEKVISNNLYLISYQNLNLNIFKLTFKVKFYYFNIY